MVGYHRHTHFFAFGLTSDFNINFMKDIGNYWELLNDISTKWWKSPAHLSSTCSSRWQDDSYMAESITEPQHDKTNKLTSLTSKDSDQPGHLPCLIIVHSMDSSGPKVSLCGQRRLWSDWVDAQGDRSLHWAHTSFCWFCQVATQLMMHQVKLSKCANATCSELHALG